MAYNVGQIVRDVQREFRLVGMTREQLEAGEQNRATPENIAILLQSLRDFTLSTIAQRNESILVGEALQAWDASMLEWRERLAEYTEETEKAPPGDRADILWSVTAPLLVGFYGGEDSNLPQQPADVATPFSLANQLQVAQEWQTEALALFFDDVRQNIRDVADVVTKGISTVALVGIGLVALLLLRRR